MVKVISTSNAAPFLSFPLGFADWGSGGSRVMGRCHLQIPKKKLCLKLNIYEVEVWKKEWFRHDDLHLSLQACTIRERVRFPFIDPLDTRYKIQHAPKSSVKLDTPKTRDHFSSPARLLAQSCWGIPHTKRPRFVVLTLVSCEFTAPIFPLSRGDKGCFSSENLRGVGCS